MDIVATNVTFCTSPKGSRSIVKRVLWSTGPWISPSQLLQPRLASHLSLELAWDVPFKPHAALLCALPLKPLQDLQPILRTITDSFDPILESQRSLEIQVISPQRVTLLEIEACDPLSLAFAQFSATAERGVSLPTIRQPAVSQAPDAYQWFGHSHSVWSQLAGRLQAGGPKREILYLLSKLGSDHRQWVETARAAVLSTRGTETLTSYAAEQARLAWEAQRVDQTASYQQWLSGALVAGMGPVYRALKSHEQTWLVPLRASPPSLEPIVAWSSGVAFGMHPLSLLQLVFLWSASP